MLHATADWLAGHPLLVAASGVLSVALLAVTVFAAPRLIARLPSDYFVVERAPLAGRGPLRMALLIVRTLVGLAFMALGLVMLITPGPGVIALLLGLSLCEFPGRHALVRRIAARPRVFRSLNWIREREHSAPFRHPGLHSEP